MRSPTDASADPRPVVRVTLEWLLRLLALASIALLLRTMLRSPDVRGEPRAFDPESIASWRESTAVGDTVRLAMRSAPPPALRDELAAMAAAGRIVRWSDGGVPALVASVEPARAPDASPTLMVAAPAGSDVAFADAAGTLDSTRAGEQALALMVPGDGHALYARAGATQAHVAARESLLIRRVLVIGRAGWESKFTIAALEEAGWRVDADIGVAPSARVVQQADVQQAGVQRGATPSPDTARYAAVVLLDSTAARPPARAAAIVRFVRAGGGVVVAGDAALASALAPLVAGRAGARVAGEAGALVASSPRRGLPLRPVAAGADAIVLERRGAAAAVAARRVGAGRVVQVGYEDSWRWRMEGDASAPADHRRWWSAVVGSVARAPARADTTVRADPTLDAAPRASLVAALGAPVVASEVPAHRERDRRLPDSLLFAIAMLALLGEWASRRLRGAR